MAEEGGRDHEAVFCDTNVLVRLLSGEPQAQAVAAGRALGSDSERVVLTDLIIAELAYVLVSRGRLDNEEAARQIATLLDLPCVEVGDEAMIRDALSLWASARVGFPDAYLAALNRQTRGTAVLSFDRDFDRIQGVERIDPAQY